MANQLTRPIAGNALQMLLRKLGSDVPWSGAGEGSALGQDQLAMGPTPNMAQVAPAASGQGPAMIEPPTERDATAGLMRSLGGSGDQGAVDWAVNSGPGNRFYDEAADGLLASLGPHPDYDTSRFSSGIPHDPLSPQDTSLGRTPPAAPDQSVSFNQPMSVGKADMKPVQQLETFAPPHTSELAPGDTGWLEQSMAERRARYNAPKAAPSPGIEETNPLLMGLERASIGDIPVGNRSTPARRWAGMDGELGGGLEADPLGATRMSQPNIGGIPATDANDARRAAETADYEKQLAMLDALEAKAGPLWGSADPKTGAPSPGGLPSHPDEARRILMERGAGGGPDADVANWMAGNMNKDPLGRYGKSGGPVAKMGSPGDRKYTDGRIMDLADRELAVEDNAADRRMARQFRMGEGPAIANRQRQEFLDTMNGQQNSGGFMNPIAGQMMGIPGVDDYNKNVAAQQDHDARMAAVGVQEGQLKSIQEQREAEQRSLAAPTLPNPQSIASQIKTAYKVVKPSDVKMHADDLLQKRYTVDKVKQMLVSPKYGFDPAMVEQILPGPPVREGVDMSSQWPTLAPKDPQAPAPGGKYIEPTAAGVAGDLLKQLPGYWESWSPKL